MEVKIVEVAERPSKTGGTSTTTPRKHLECPSCETQDEIYVRIFCAVDFDADYYDKGMDKGVGFSMETASNIEPINMGSPDVGSNARQIICANCGEHLELPEGMRLIQDV